MSRPLVDIQQDLELTEARLAAIDRQRQETEKKQLILLSEQYLHPDFVTAELARQDTKLKWTLGDFFYTTWVTGGGDDPLVSFAADDEVLNLEFKASGWVTVKWNPEITALFDVPPSPHAFWDTALQVHSGQFRQAVASVFVMAHHCDPEAILLPGRFQLLKALGYE